MIIHGNLWRSNSDQRQISLCNINAFLVRIDTRVKDMITKKRIPLVD